MSRIVVWTLVGIVVVAGVIVIAAAPKRTQGPKLTLDSVKVAVAQADSQLAKLVSRVETGRRRIAPGSGPNPYLAQADSLLAQARENLDQALAATDLKQATQFLTDGRLALRRARRAVELATKPGSRRPGMP